MAVIWIIIKIAVYTFVLNVLYRQSYNFIFILAQRPKTWILFVGCLGFGNMMLAYALGWDPSLVSAAVITAFIINIAPSLSKEKRDVVREIYKEWGLPYGRLQSNLGLAAFFMCSMLTYILLFGELCETTPNSRSECVNLFHMLTLPNAPRGRV